MGRQRWYGADDASLPPIMIVVARSRTLPEVFHQLRALSSS